MNKKSKQLKSYLNENGLRFNLNEQRIWKYIEETFGENRARELSDIFDETYIDKSKAIDVSRKYQFCNSFEEATTLMYFQSNWFLKNSNIILEDILKREPKSILELGCYTGIFSNYLTKILENSNITGVDIEDNLINFGKDKFNNEKLNLICIDYKELKKLNKKYDYIFTNFGIEEIPNPKFNTYKIRENNNYKSQLKYFSNFFLYLNEVAEENTKFFCLARISSIECLLSMVDAAHSMGWKWISDDLEYINYKNEFIPKLYFSKTKSEKIDLEKFINETLKLKNEDNNELFQISKFENEKSKLKLLNKDSYKYEETNDELFYEIYKQDDLYVLFAWTTLGYFRYKKFNTKEKLVELFIEETELIIDADKIN
ncbi:class I SAM-dependent methyltransferase [Candidatus Pelagibacter sp.]|nr:class I SAM-dependent methyltransferase [Candidatus Pelagibacter sp.]